MSHSGDYSAANPRSSARGAYQFLTGSWAAYGHAKRYGVSTADKASPAQQDEAAVITWERSGTRPWNSQSPLLGLIPVRVKIDRLFVIGSVGGGLVG